MRVLTWNLFHGRSPEPRGRDLRDDFAALIASWAWDVALLQEVLPWWPAHLGRAAGASARSVRTSRDFVPPARWLARPFPDVVKSWGGGANAILVRGQAIAEHRRVLLRALPERRLAHGVRLADGTWVANLHAHVRPPLRARLDTARAGVVAQDWAQGARLLLGGDFNHRDPAVAGLRDLGGHGIDRVLGRGFEPVGKALPDRLGLSDHEPVLLEVRPC
jgi:endonuclease/exonuclease/phosphatase family metal-dependent hydrolase